MYDGEHLWANISDLGPKTLMLTARTLSDAGAALGGATPVPVGALLYAFKLSIGQVSFAGVPMYTNEAIAAFLPNPRLDLAWAYYSLPLFLWHSAETNIYGARLLNQERIRGAQIALPPLPEQRAIAAFLDRETAKIDDLIAEQQRLIALLTEKRQAVISHAVTKGLNPDVPMKDSGVEWLGEVPEHWKISQSRRLFALRNDRAKPDDQQLTASQKYGIIYQKDFMEIEGQRVVQVIHGADILKHVEVNDFVISMRSFQGGIEWSNLSGSISSAYVMLIPSNEIFSGFFKYLFKSRSYIQALQSTSNLVRDGQALRYDNFVLIDLPILPIEEQILIAEFLDKETSFIDTLISEAQQAVVLLQERRSALISAAVTGKIDVRGAVA